MITLETLSSTQYHPASYLNQIPDNQLAALKQSLKTIQSQLKIPASTSSKAALNAILNSQKAVEKSQNTINNVNEIILKIQKLTRDKNLICDKIQSEKSILIEEIKNKNQNKQILTNSLALLSGAKICTKLVKSEIIPLADQVQREILQQNLLENQNLLAVKPCGIKLLQESFRGEFECFVKKQFTDSLIDKVLQKNKFKVERKSICNIFNIIISSWQNLPKSSFKYYIDQDLIQECVIVQSVQKIVNEFNQFFSKENYSNCVFMLQQSNLFAKSIIQEINMVEFQFEISKMLQINNSVQMYIQYSIQHIIKCMSTAKEIGEFSSIVKNFLDQIYQFPFTLKGENIGIFLPFTSLDLCQDDFFIQLISSIFREIEQVNNARNTNKYTNTVQQVLFRQNIEDDITSLDKVLQEFLTVERLKEFSQADLDCFVQNLYYGDVYQIYLVYREIMLDRLSQAVTLFQELSKKFVVLK